MGIQNYMPFSVFSTGYPVKNHSSRIFLPIIGLFPVSSDKEDYVEHIYLADDYILGDNPVYIVPIVPAHPFGEDYIDPTYYAQDYIL